MLFARVRNLSSVDRPLSDRLGSLLIPRVFLASIAAGFILASLLGYLSTKRPLFQDFVRIHQLIGSESLFNVTALQVWRLVEGVPADKVLVIVGGTSRFNGTGQTPAGLWSQRLQQMLGPDYSVINLALRAGSPDQFGSYAAEAMIKEGRKVIYVADIMLFYELTGIGSLPAYRYFYYDASSRSLLLKSRSREAVVRAQEESPDTKLELQELYLRALLNRFAFFDDLWNYVGYWQVFLGAWSPLALPSPTEARVRKRDREQSVPAGGYYRYYDFEEQVTRYRGYARKFEQGRVSAVEKSLKTLPRPLRIRSIWVTVYNSPYYTTHLTDEEQLIYAGNFAAMDAALRRTGYASLVLGPDWNADDFADGLHLSEQGGRKLAAAVATLVVQKALALGYLK
jgi:hypothetical protein